VLVHHAEGSLDGRDEPYVVLHDGQRQARVGLLVQLLLALLDDGVEGFVHAEVVVIVFGV